MLGTDSVERAIAEQRFTLTTAGAWTCVWCGKTFPDVAMRQTLDAHLRTCTRDVCVYVIQPPPPVFETRPRPRGH